MPVYEILIDDKPRRVELTKKGDKSFVVKVDGKTSEVVLGSQEFDVKNPISLRINGEMFQVELPSIEREKPFPVKVEEASFKAEMKSAVVKLVLSSFEPDVQLRSAKPSVQKQVVVGAVTAPMTGKIILVRVKKGDQVKQGQVVCVVEAMKMENEINAPKSGVVQEVRVFDGASVSEGDVLVVIG